MGHRVRFPAIKLTFGGTAALLLACGGVASSAPGPSEQPARIDPARVESQPFQGRAGHSAAVLLDGRVLFTGGSSSATNAEYYSPTDQVWVSVGPLTQARSHHAMVRLHSGRVLLIGGQDPSQADPNADPVPLASAEVFDPSTDAFTQVSPSSAGFMAPKAALLTSGQVLVVHCEVGAYRAEIYDPASDAWTEAPAPERCAQDDDLVSVTGGALFGNGGSAYTLERYDSATRAWVKTAPAPRKRTNRLLVLANGTVLATGLLSAELDEPDVAIFDPGANTWEATPDIPRTYNQVDHANFGLTESGDRVWRVGGSSGRPPLPSSHVEIWDQASHSWASGPELSQARASASATALPDGSVLVYGGRGTRGGPPLPTAEVLRR